MMSKLNSFDWNQTKSFSILQLILVFALPSLLSYIGFHIILPLLIKNDLPILISWASIASVMLLFLVILALIFLKREAKQLNISLASRMCLKRLSLKEWLTSLAIIILGLFIASMATNLIGPFMQITGLEVPQYMPFFLDPSQSNTSTNFPYKGQYIVLVLMGITLILNIFAEELYFRSWILPKLSQYGKMSWIINGTMFALYHTFQFWLFPTILVGSLLWAFIIFHTKSIFPALVGHFVGNFLFSMVMLSMLVFGIN